MPNTRPDAPSEGLTVALKEYVESKIKHERELREEAFRSRDKTLDVQAREYSRRLEELNGHLKRTTDDRSEFFRKEAHEQFAVEYRRFRDETRRHQDVVRTWGTAGLIGLGVLQFAIQFALHFWSGKP